MRENFFSVVAKKRTRIGSDPLAWMKIGSGQTVKRKNLFFEEQEQYRGGIGYLEETKRIVNILIDELSGNLRKRRSAK